MEDLGTLKTKVLAGATSKEVPITMSKSTFLRSRGTFSKNTFGRLDRNNTIEGLTASAPQDAHRIGVDSEGALGSRPVISLIWRSTSVQKS
mmetsp:Transcript_5062/g.5883  ORF Transcript_5062/g.5883 Transcript_5062/m.5883 type:complete len:91 (+) Transcript_5062:335-607(+)